MRKVSQIALSLALLSSGLAFAGGTTTAAPAEASAVAPAPAPVVAAPAPVAAPVTAVSAAPVVIAPAFVPFSYAGIGAGRSELQYVNAPAGVNIDDSDTAWKIFAGHRFHPNFAAEVSYTDLGEASARSGGNTFEADAVAFNLVGILPVAPQLDVFAKAGFAVWDAEDRLNGAAAEDDGTDAQYGVGASWNFSRNVALRAEWERFQLDDNDADVTSASIAWKF